MAIPKPVRFLALATMAVFIFLLYHIMQNPSVARVPGVGGDGSKKKIVEMTRDPNLDRKHDAVAGHGGSSS
jgi:mannosyltransferase